MEIKIKRIYDTPSASDGTRILIDRLWPRGLTKAQAAVDNWLKELAPSSALRKWYNHEPLKYREFQQKYLAELSEHNSLESFLEFIRPFKTVTLVFAAKDAELSNAHVLQQALFKRLGV